MDTNKSGKAVHQQELKPYSFATYFNLGVDCRQRGDKQGAINAWTEALRIDPQNTHAYYERGVIRAEGGDYSGAVEDFNQVIRINPKYHNAYLQQDKIFQNLFKDSQVFSLNPKNAVTYLNRGKIHLQFKEYKESIKDFNQALQLNPHLAEAYYNRGKSRRQLKEQKEAIEDFQKAAQLLCDNNQVENLAEWTPFELGESNRKEAIYYLVRYLSWDSSYEQKRLAASAIDKLARSFPSNCELAIPYLLDNLSYPAPQVRQYVLKALNSLSLPNSAITQISAIAEKDPKEYNRKIAKAILKRIAQLEAEEEYEMNWVEYEDYLGCIEREPGLNPSQKIALINGREIIFKGQKVDYKGYLRVKDRFINREENKTNYEIDDYDYDEDTHEYAEYQDSEYEVNKQEDDTSMDYGYLNDVSNPYEYF